MFQAQVWCGQKGEDIGLGYTWSAGGPGVSRLGRAGGVGSCSSCEFGYLFCGDSSFFPSRYFLGAGCLGPVSPAPGALTFSPLSAHSLQAIRTL